MCGVLADTVERERMMETKLSIGGMNCGHCAQAVRDALAKVPGVDRVIEVNLDAGRATVTGDAAAEHLMAAVTAAGFEATVD
jgi:copper chaperone CopZ